MMRLLKVEMSRYYSRRLTLVAMVGLLGVVLLALFATHQSSKPLSEQQVQEATAAYESLHADWVENGDAQIADCLEGEATERETTPDADWGCADMEPQLEWFMSPDQTFVDQAPTVVPTIGFATAFFAFLVGVSFVAAEFATGSMGSWLTFEPRRSRVFWSKTVAAGIGVVVPAVVAVALTVAGTWAVFTAWGNADGITAEVWGDVAVSGLRLLLLSVGAGVLGAAVAMIVRSTAAAIGMVVGYLIVVEVLIGQLFERLQTWLLFQNVQAVLTGRSSYFVETCTTGPTGLSCEYTEEVVSLTHGAVELSVLLAVVVTVALVSFRRRDVG